MIQTNRRNLLAGAAAAALLVPQSAWAQDAPANLAELANPPANGEMPLGAADAKVTIIEYISASCPHCAAFFKDVFPTLSKDYIETGKVRFLLREFPHNDAALGAFMVARCAPPEKYHPLIEAFFTTQDKWVAKPLEGLKEIALQAGFTEDSFKTCLNNQEVAKGILAERARAEVFGVTGIPYIFINGVHYEGENTVEGLKAKIDPLLG